MHLKFECIVCVLSNPVCRLRLQASKECGGGSICEHGRVRSTCKDCGGGSICKHGRVRSKCKECGCGAMLSSVRGHTPGSAKF
jgi:hypothetical protein